MCALQQGKAGSLRRAGTQSLHPFVLGLFSAHERHRALEPVKYRTARFSRGPYAGLGIEKQPLLRGGI